MNEFMGIKNVIDAVAIIGSDGATDGFRIIYQEPRSIKTRNGKVIEKMVEKECVKYVREFDSNSVRSDGQIHGFGCGTVYTRCSGKKAKKGIEMTKSGLSSVARALGKK